MENIKKFSTHNDYLAYLNSKGYIKPNVSWCLDENHIHYGFFDKYNGYEFVDLDLPSGTVWAKYNIGAKTETDYGLYFQWGDTQGYSASQVGSASEGKKEFLFNDYKYADSVSGKTTKYNETDGKTVLDADDDAVIAHMGGEWRMPTKDDIDELVANTNVEKIEKNGVFIAVFSSKLDATKKLFIPLAGDAYNSTIENEGHGGLIWSKTMNEDWTFPYRLTTNGTIGRVGTQFRYSGCNIRGVL